MFALPSLTIGTKLAIVGGLMVASAVLAAKYTHTYVADHYENILLSERVAVVTKEKEVAVLDTKTLQTALNNQRAQLAREAEQKRVLDEILNSHKDDTEPWCELDANELCNWNLENRILMGDPTADSNECRAKLPTTGVSDNRQDRRTVGEQTRDSKEIR